MNGPTSECDALESLIAHLADEFVEQLHRGESPDVEDYVARWPGDPRVARQVLASLELVRFSSAHEPGAAALEAVDAAARLGDFQLVREIGRGGMGVVYEARQLSLGRRVALKVLPFAGMLDSRQRQRFQNEVQAAAQLDHPNIINVIGVGCERGVYYYAMRLVDGPTLADVVRQMRDARGGGPNFPQGVAELAAWSPSSSREEDVTLTRPPSTPHDAGETPFRAEKPRMNADGRRCETPLDAGETPAPQCAGGTPAPQTTGHGRAQASTWASRSGAGFYRCVAQVGIQVARALDYAHQVGIVHRDIKPSNLMVDCHGTVWVTDFGLARVEANPELTMTGDLLGTLRYMSPEQITGQRAAIDHRTDIYSLGATLYELLTGRPVFGAGQRAELLRRIATEPPLAPRKLNRSLPVELETIVLKALQKSPLDRYRTAGEMADDLQRFLDDRPIRARRSRVLGYAKAFWRRHQVLLVAVLATLLVATSVASILVWRQRQEAVAQRGLVVARDADLRQRLYAADIKQAHQAWQRGDLTRMKELLDRYAGPADDELREFAWHYLSSLLAARPAPSTVLRPGHGNIYCVQFSPDGKHLAAACDDGHVNVWSVPDWSLRHNLAAHQADADCVAFSSDGRLLASGGEDGWLRLWDVETGELRQSLDAGQKETLTVAISPDGQTLAAGGIDGLVRLWHMPDGQLRKAFRASSGRVQHLAFSPDGTKLATAGQEGAAMIVDATTCERLTSLPSQAVAAFAVAFSPQGDRVALGSGTGLVMLIDPSSGRTESLLGVRQAQVRAVAFAPSAPRLASAGLSGAVDVWDTETRSLRAKLYGHERRIWSLSFSPDGKLLASGGDDGSVHIWDPGGESGLTHNENPESIYELKFAPGGDRLVTATDKQELVTWAAATLRRQFARPLPSVAMHAFSFDPDRHEFAVRTMEGEIWCGGTTDGALAKFDPGLSGPVEKIALAGNARLLVWYADGALEVWDRAAEKLLDRRSLGYGPGSWPAAISCDGRLVVNCGNGLDFEPLNAVLFYEVESLSARVVQSNYVADFFALALSPENRWLAVARADGPIDFFNTASDEKAFSLTGHQASVDSLAFSPDGRTLASASRGGVVRLWHLATREELFIIHRIDAAGLLHIDFSPDGRRLAAATGDREAHGHIFVWSTAAGEGAPQTTGPRRGAP